MNDPGDPAARIPCSLNRFQPVEAMFSMEWSFQGVPPFGVQNKGEHATDHPCR
jgi:hypothetical protein